MSTLTEALPLVLPLVVGGALIGLAVFVFRTARDRADNLVFSSLYLLSGIKSLSEGVRPIADGLHDRAAAFPVASFWASLAFLCAVVMLPLLFLFLLLFPRPQPFLLRRPVWGFLLFLPSLVFAYLFLARPWAIDVDQLALALNLLAVLLTILALAVILHTFRTTPDAIERRRAQYILIGFVPAFAGTWIVASLEVGRVYGGVQPSFELVFVNYVTPFLELLAAGVTAFAILKYRLLGFELKVKVGAKYTLTTTAIVGILFTANKYVESKILNPYFGSFTKYYWVIGGIAGVALFRPFERAAAAVTNRLFPDTTKPQAEYRDKRAAEIYHVQATHVLRDARVTERELRFLRALRVELGLSQQEAQRIEERVERMLKVDSPQLGLRSSS